MTKKEPKYYLSVRTSDAIILATTTSTPTKNGRKLLDVDDDGNGRERLATNSDNWEIVETDSDLPEGYQDGLWRLVAGAIVPVGSE